MFEVSTDFCFRALTRPSCVQFKQEGKDKWQKDLKSNEADDEEDDTCNSCIVSSLRAERFHWQML